MMRWLCSAGQEVLPCVPGASESLRTDRQQSERQPSVHYWTSQNFCKRDNSGESFYLKKKIKTEKHSYLIINKRWINVSVFLSNIKELSYNLKWLSAFKLLLFYLEVQNIYHVIFKSKLIRIVYFSYSRVKWLNSIFLRKIPGSCQKGAYNSIFFMYYWGLGHIGAVGKQGMLFQSDYKARSESAHLFWPAWGFPMTTK